MMRPRFRFAVAPLAAVAGCAGASKPQPATPSVATRDSSAPKKVSPELLQSLVLEHDYPRLPDKVRAAHAGEEISVMYFVTVGTDGSVLAVAPYNAGATAEARRTVADVDAVVEDTLRAWKFKPQPIPMRSIMRFVFTIVPAHQ